MPMNPPFADPWRASRKIRKAQTCVVLAGAFAVGIATGVGLCAVAFGRDLFDRLPR